MCVCVCQALGQAVVPLAELMSVDVVDMMKGCDNEGDQQHTRVCLPRVSQLSDYRESKNLKVYL